MDKKTIFDSAMFPEAHMLSATIPFYTKKYIVTFLNATVLTSEHHWIVSQHSHNFFEFNFFTEGELELSIEDNTHILTSGAFFVAGPDVLHSQVSKKGSKNICYSFSVSIEPNKGREYSSFTFLDDDFDDILDIIVNNPSYAGNDTSNAVSIIKQIIDNSEISKGIVNINLTQFKLFILQFLISTAQNISPLKKINISEFNLTPDTSRIGILDHIFANYFEEMSPAIAADRLHVSQRQLNRICTDYYNKSFKQKYIESRINLSLILLKEFDTFSIDEIAQKLNFSSAQYFSKVFKAHTGITPKEYRKGIACKK